MSNVLKIDDQGRIILPEEYRKKHGKKFRYFTFGDRLEIIPISEKPLKELRSDFSQNSKDKTTDELIDKARKKSKDNRK